MMEASEIVKLVTGLFTTGGLFYLLVDKFFGLGESRANIKRQEVENKKETIEYGISMVSIYNEIDKIVESKTMPIQMKLDEALDRIDQLESKYCCYREDCPDRILRSADCERMEILGKMVNRKLICGHKDKEDNG
nr:MAG TPA: Nitrosopumilus output domain 5 [Caudoviricetes sp.]